MSINVIDLFCGAGGATVGLVDGGATQILGIDNDPSALKEYDYLKMFSLSAKVHSHLGDVFVAIDKLHRGAPDVLKAVDFVWASPPCQAYTWSTRKGRKHNFPDYMEVTRAILQLLQAEYGISYVIENVPGAPLHEPSRLCGEMFDLGVIRHRHFETSWPMIPPKHVKHKPPIVRHSKADPTKMIQVSQYCCVSGHGGNSNSFKLEDWRRAMGIGWMSKKHLVEAVPPDYAKYILEDWRVFHGK